MPSLVEKFLEKARHINQDTGKYLAGFRRMIQEHYGDITGRIYQHPTHLTFSVHSPWQTVLVHFALHRFGKRLELSATVRFEYVGTRKYIGITFIDGRWYALDFDGESGLLFPCFES